MEGREKKMETRIRQCKKGMERELSKIALSEIIFAIKSQDNNSKHNKRQLFPVGRIDSQDLFRGVTPK